MMWNSKVGCNRGHYDMEIKVDGHRGHYHF